jgi:hypothetical protein
MIQRILQGTGDTLSVQVTVAEAGTDPTPDAAAVTVTRADGTVVTAAATAQNGPAGTFMYPLIPAETALLDVLTATWTVTLAGQPQTLVTRAEVVGGHHFTLAELRAMAPLGDTNAYPTGRLVEARAEAEDFLETECGRAFVPRYWRGTVGDVRSWPFPDVRRVREVRAPDGTAWSAVDLDYMNTGWGYPGRWAARRRGRWTVALEHGMDACPPYVARASRLLARNVLTGNASASMLDERATSVTYADAGLTYGLVTGGVRGAASSIPEVNVVVDQYGTAAVV